MMICIFKLNLLSALSALNSTPAQNQPRINSRNRNMTEQEEQMEVDMDYEYTYLADEPKEEELFQINELMAFLYEVLLIFNNI
jgi:hypothetical protein